MTKSSHIERALSVLRERFPRFQIDCTPEQMDSATYALHWINLHTLEWEDFQRRRYAEPELFEVIFDKVNAATEGDLSQCFSEDGLDRKVDWPFLLGAAMSAWEMTA